MVKKNFFTKKLSLPWEWHNTYHENIYYKSFSLPVINTVNQIDVRVIKI